MTHIRSFTSLGAAVLVAGLATAFGLPACSSSPSDPVTPAADATAETETSVVVDARPETPPVETGPISCIEALPNDFKCEPIPEKAGKKVCTDAAIDELETACTGAGTAATCRAAQNKYPACNACLLEWLVGFSLDTASCMRKVDPADPCSTSVACNFACLDTSCDPETCDREPGSGRTPSRSAYDDCRSDVTFAGNATRPKGACYDLASKDAAACIRNAKFAVCNQFKTWLRGACRDGGDWTNADQDQTPAGDAGTETGTDAGLETGIETGIETGVETGLDADAG
jgi:hypothetical protein